MENITNALQRIEIAIKYGYLNCIIVNVILPKPFIEL